MVEDLRITHIQEQLKLLTVLLKSSLTFDFNWIKWEAGVHAGGEVAPKSSKTGETS